jgi:hypothetical protein
LVKGVATEKDVRQSDHFARGQAHTADPDFGKIAIPKTSAFGQYIKRIRNREPVVSFFFTKQNVMLHGLFPFAFG